MNRSQHLTIISHRINYGQMAHFQIVAKNKEILCLFVFSILLVISYIMYGISIKKVTFNYYLALYII